MDLEEYQLSTRNRIEQTLNQLQTSTLLVAQLETQIFDVGRSVQDLSLLLETFLAQQQAGGQPPTEPT